MAMKDDRADDDGRTVGADEIPRKISDPAGSDRPVGAGLSARERTSLFFRSFLIQSVWNPRGMQNVGFCFAVLPVARRLRGDARARGAFLARHLVFFNTNPSLSTYVLSASASAEVALDPDGAQKIKRALSGPLGMAGDALFWGAARPLAALAAVAAALMGARWAPAVLLAVYNVPHIVLRARGVSRGSALGALGAREVFGKRFRGLVSSLRALLFFAAGLVAALGVGAEGGATLQLLVIAGGFFLLTLVALKVRVPVTAIGLAGVVGGVAIMLTRT